MHNMTFRSISHACGHDQEHTVYGASAERDEKVKWLSDTTCTRCYHAADNAIALDKARVMGLPDLQGSDRQIGWAAAIRQRGLAEIDAKRARMVEAMAARVTTVRDIDTDYMVACLQAYHAALINILGETSAAWWIDNQHGIAHICLRTVKADLPALRAANNARLGLPHPDDIERAKAEKKAAEKADAEAARQVERTEWVARDLAFAAWRATHDPYIDQLLPLIGTGWSVDAQGDPSVSTPRNVVATHRVHKIMYSATSNRLTYDVHEDYQKNRAAVKMIFARISREKEFEGVFIE